MTPPSTPCRMMVERTGRSRLALNRLTFSRRSAFLSIGSGESTMQAIEAADEDEIRARMAEDRWALMEQVLDKLESTCQARNSRHEGGQRNERHPRTRPGRRRAGAPADPPNPGFRDRARPHPPLVLVAYRRRDGRRGGGRV